MSLEDLFLAGLGFDVAGAVLLGRSLLKTPADARRRTGMWVGFNAADLAAAARDRADAIFGIFGLATGFVFQGAGYITILAGAHVREGGAARITLGGVFLLAAVAVVAVLRLCLGWPVMRRFVVAMASVMPSEGASGDDVYLDRPTFDVLLSVGDRLGRPQLVSETPDAYVNRVYGLDGAEVDVGTGSTGSSVRSIVGQHQKEQYETFYKPMEDAVAAGVRRVYAFVRRVASW